jgi:hypothetical protein
MAAIALQSGVTRLSVVESIEQDTHPAAAAITAPAIVKQNTSGQWAAAVAADTGVYLVVKSVPAGMPVTGIKQGVVDGLNLSALAYGAPLYSNASGVPDTATSTNALIIGEVIAAHSNQTGAAADKLFRVDMP